MKWNEVAPNRFVSIDAESGTVATIEPLPWDASVMGVVIENAQVDYKSARLTPSFTHAKSFAEGEVNAIKRKYGNSFNNITDIT